MNKENLQLRRLGENDKGSDTRLLYFDLESVKDSKNE